MHVKTNIGGRGGGGAKTPTCVYVNTFSLHLGVHGIFAMSVADK
jgi:hypothetical protein